MHDWTVAREHAPGLLLRGELLAQGYDDRSLHHAVRRGVLERVRPGAYVPAGALDALAAVDRHRLLARAVLLQSRADTVLSHVSALVESGVEVWGASLEQVHLTRPDQRAGRRHRTVVQHRGVLGGEDVVRCHGLAVTSGTRTALDLCCVLGQQAAVVAVCGLLGAGLTDHRRLRERYAELTQRPGSLGTDVVLRLADGRCESVGERRALYLCWRLGLPAPTPQYEVRGSDGFLARLDFAWPDRRVWLEFDGKVKYCERLRPGERPVDAVFREKQREDRVRGLTGWICVRITWVDLEHPERLVEKVRRAFALAA